MIISDFFVCMPVKPLIKTCNKEDRYTEAIHNECKYFVR